MGEMLLLPYRNNLFVQVSFIFFLTYRQVALADLIIINKTDLVSGEELNKVRTSIRYETFSVTVMLYWVKCYFTV